jgi:hypothetical protein
MSIILPALFLVFVELVVSAREWYALVGVLDARKLKKKPEQSVQFSLDYSISTVLFLLLSVFVELAKQTVQLLPCYFIGAHLSVSCTALDEHIVSGCVWY